MTRADIVASARQWLGTPFQHQARLRDVGVDCVGLVIGVAAGLGVKVVQTYCDPLARPWGLVLCLLVAPAFERDVQIYSAPGRSLTPAATAFVQVLTALAAEPSAVSD